MGEIFGYNPKLTDHKISNPQIAEELAAYYEATAAELRSLAESLKRNEIKHFERSKQLWSSGSKCADLVKNGMPESLAVTTVAAQSNIPVESVEAHYQRKKKIDIKEIQANKAKKLKQNKQTIRQIAVNMNISKSTVQRLLKR